MGATSLFLQGRLEAPSHGAQAQTECTGVPGPTHSWLLKGLVAAELRACISIPGPPNSTLVGGLRTPLVSLKVEDGGSAPLSPANTPSGQTWLAARLGGMGLEL